MNEADSPEENREPGFGCCGTPATGQAPVGGEVAWPGLAWLPARTKSSDETAAAARSPLFSPQQLVERLGHRSAPRDRGRDLAADRDRRLLLLRLSRADHLQAGQPDRGANLDARPPRRPAS